MFDADPYDKSIDQITGLLQTATNLAAQPEPGVTSHYFTIAVMFEAFI